jgi:sugar/nucleoside kinase (ribokinase family)
VIVVIGAISADLATGAAVPAGSAVAIGRAAAAEGARVELVARVGDDPIGDAVLLAIAAAGIGHVATLRDPARTQVATHVEEPTDLEEDAGHVGAVVDDQPGPTLDGADVGLALRYLSDYRVIVTVHPSNGVLAEAVAAASYAGASLIVVTDPSGDPDPGDALPGDTLVLAAEAGAIGVGATIGRYAAAIDGGTDPATAFAATLGATEVTV